MTHKGIRFDFEQAREDILNEYINGNYSDFKQDIQKLIKQKEFVNFLIYVFENDKITFKLILNYLGGRI